MPAGNSRTARPFRRCMKKLPHESVYVRLGLSDVHGIGVFAIRTIPEGTNIFADDQVELVWVDAAEIDREGIGEQQRRFYEDFGIRSGDRIGCPVSFNNLTPGWYLNEPPPGAAPSIEVDERLNFIAIRRIEKGEELTVRYADFSDPPGEARDSGD
jgi:uncharacterized protein